MVAPIIIAAGFALATGAYGIERWLKSTSNNKKIEKTKTQALGIYNSAKTDLETSINETTLNIDKLNWIKLNVGNRQFDNFLKIINQIEEVKIYDSTVQDELNITNYSNNTFHINITPISTSEIAEGGCATIAVSSTAAIITYGSVAAFGTASTGTAIGTLSGAAVNSAVLAQLGGGSLAVGGLGMAGGAAILGTVVLGPALAMSGHKYAKKTEKDLKTAEEYLKEIKEITTEWDKERINMNEIKQVSIEFQDVLTKIDKSLTDLIFKSQVIIHDVKVRQGYLPSNDKRININYTRDDEKILLNKTKDTFITLKRLLEVSLLNDTGKLNPECKEILRKCKQSFEHTY